MTKDALAERGRSLEEAFFLKQNEALKQRLRQAQETSGAAEAMAEASGIRDPAVLKRLAELGLRADTLAALTLIPLIQVAWADGNVADNERRAVLSGARDLGVEAGSPCYELLENWLRTRPAPALIEAWGEYVAALCAFLGAEEKVRLGDNLLQRARAVAETAGGYLGLKTVSKQERAVLEGLERAFRA